MFGKKPVVEPKIANPNQRVDSLIAQAANIASQLEDSIVAISAKNDTLYAQIATANASIADNNTAIQKAKAASDQLKAIAA